MISITLDAAYVVAENGYFTHTCVKFGSRPTDSEDFDYRNVSGGTRLESRDGTMTFAPFTVSVQPVCYIWQRDPEQHGGYKLNDGLQIAVSDDYSQATEVHLSANDTLTLYNTWD